MYDGKDGIEYFILKYSSHIKHNKFSFGYLKTKKKKKTTA